MAKGWSDEELAAAVKAYRHMETMQASATPYSKKQVYRDLAKRYARTEKSFEYRMQNISAVLDELGMPWLPGLKPAVNVGSEMKARLVRLLGAEALGATSVSVDLVAQRSAQGLRTAGQVAESAGAFDPMSVEDARERVYASIVRRRGQATFRKQLLEAYGGSCAISGCEVTEILEAAHIHPYKGAHTHSVSNGLLLRADLHTLFDLGLIVIDTPSLRVKIAPALRHTEYSSWHDAALRPPKLASQRASQEALEWHRLHIGWQ
ncbi:TPA: HNH endonuclease [Pseudomonas aeruginosa]|nr:HNH endonuclease [Pseudomonas aeruginosa]HCD6626730.1 HNH endonuclease [Pseudomonas aeruginosa]